MAIRLTRKKIALGTAGIVIVLAIVGTVSWSIWRSSQDGSGTKVPMVSVGEVPIAALSYANAGDVDGGLNYYDSQIVQRTDTTDKRRLLLYKSDFAVGVKRYKEALSAAKQADAIKADISSAVALARVYEGMGDKQQAVIYYKKALELSPKDGLGSRDEPLWEQKVKELQP